jgi:hypothetical protein
VTLNAASEGWYVECKSEVKAGSFAKAASAFANTYDFRLFLESFSAFRTFWCIWCGPRPNPGRIENARTEGR